MFVFSRAIVLAIVLPCVLSANPMALLDAASSGNVAAAEAALADGADINYQHPQNGQSPLMAAVLGGQPEIVALMLKYVSLLQCKLATLTDFACRKGADTSIPEKVCILTAFLTRGLTILFQDGYTPMHGAGFQGRAEIAQMLIDHVRKSV